MCKGINERNGGILLQAGNNKTSKSINRSPTTIRPWYIRGGFHVNEVGMGLNVVVPPILLFLTAGSSLVLSGSLLLVQIIMAVGLDGMSTTFCIFVVPLYLTSLILLPGTLTTGILPTLALATAIAIGRGGVCMSVCLHRYAAHAAFKCGPGTRLVLNLLGCAAHQGGPIWWASQHRCHHKHCETEYDPHSPLQDGVERAFCFFETGHGTVKEEFAPRHNDTWLLRLLDTFSFIVCMIEMSIVYIFFGREGLFISYTSIWMCQCATLWFNIMNHPPDVHPGKICQASNTKGQVGSGCYYPGFWFLDMIYPLFSSLTSESNHGDHHVHSTLAKREKYDLFYHTFVLPLELMGIVWDVKKVSSPE